MLGFAVDLERIAAPAGQRIAQPRLRVEPRPPLVEHGQFQRRAQFDAAAIGFQQPGQHLDQRRLAGPVRPDNPHPVAAQHAGGKFLDDGPAAKAFRNVLGLGHQSAGGAALAYRHGDIAGGAALFAPVLSQPRQPFQAPHIALAPCGHAIAQPMLFAHDLAVELVAVFFFLLQHLVTPAFKCRKTLLDTAGHAAVEPDGGAGEVGEEPPIMADQHQRRADLAEFILQPLDHRQVEMVGGLIEQQHVRLRRQNPRQCSATPLAARERLGVFRACQPQRLEQILRAIGIVARRQPSFHIGQRRGMAGEVGLLRQIADRGAWLGEAHPGIVLDQPGGDLEQCRLARTVAPDQGNPLPRRDDQFRRLEQLRAAKSQLDILERKKRGRGHAQSGRKPVRRDRA